MQDQIFDMLLEEEEISWKNIIYDLVKTEQMDPWDVNITKLTGRYIEVIKQMQEHDLKVSGKIILAAAILLKIKSTHLLDKDISNFDALLQAQDEDEYMEIEEEILDQEQRRKGNQPYTLIPRNPQPRNRKVSVEDLVQALGRAMRTKRRVLAKIRPQSFNKILHSKKIDMMEVIRDVFHKIEFYTKKDQKDTITFSRLLPPKAGREEKVYTFLPLLHLENHHRINMEQSEPFEEIHVKLKKKKKAKAK